MRQERSIKNLFYGLLSFVITTIMSVVIPRLFLLSYGSEVNGLISSVKQIFAYFLLLEAGVGGAARQALYGPIAKKDKKEVSAILTATNNFYKKIALIYASAVIVLAVIYPLTVKSEISKIVIICIILFQGEAGVIKSLITGKLQLLIQVDGKNYILTNISTVFSIFSNAARIILLYMGAGVLWVQGVFCIVDLCQVAIIVIYTYREYPWVSFKEQPNYSAISQKNSVLVHQIAGLIFNNTDTIILTFFCGLKTVSVYAMYTMLYGMVANIIGYISSSVSFAMGQLFNSDIKRFKRIQECYENYYLCFSFALFSIAYIFITPFLKLYTSGVNDIKYIDKILPIMFLIIQLLNYGRTTSGNIIDYAGHYKKTQNRSIIETIINILISLIGVARFGIYGVLLGTIAALLYRTNDMIIYANHVIMKRSAIPTYRRWIRNIILSICVAFAGRFLPSEYNGYVQIIVYAAVVMMIVLCVFFFINTVLEKEARTTGYAYISNFMHKRLCKEEAK